MSDSKKVIAKIEKLLSLAQSSNEHEARLAAEKASELLIRHNLTLQQIVGRDPSYVIEERENGQSRYRVEDKYVCQVIQQFFFVRVLIGRRLDTASGSRRVRTVISFVGDEVNAKVAAFVWEFLTRKYKELFSGYCERNGASNRVRQSYYLGLTIGLSEQLKARRSTVEDHMALVVVDDPRLNDFVNSVAHGERRDSFVKKADAHASEAGVADGRVLQIQRGIEHRATDSNLMLEANR